ncbi:MAG: hypothetical protein ACREH9_13885 [Pseudomonadota bacterium]
MSKTLGLIAAGAVFALVSPSLASPSPNNGADQAAAMNCVAPMSSQRHAAVQTTGTRVIQAQAFNMPAYNYDRANFAPGD